MGYLENGFFGNPNSSKAKIKEMLDVMDEEQRKLTLSRVKEAFPDVEEKAQEERLKRIEGKIHCCESAIRDLEAKYKRLCSTAAGDGKAIRRLNVAVIALAAGWVAFIAVLTILSLS